MYEYRILAEKMTKYGFQKHVEMLGESYSERMVNRCDRLEREGYDAVIQRRETGAWENV
jgi:hypothetical protein